MSIEYYFILLVILGGSQTIMARRLDEKITIGKFSYSRADRIASGTYSSVYRGSLDNVKEVCIKKFVEEKTHIDIHRLWKADDHPNIVRYCMVLFNIITAKIKNYFISL